MAARKKAAPKRGASRYQAPAKKPVHPLVWVLTGLIVGIFAMSLFQLDPGNDAIKREKPVAENKKPTPQAQKETNANKPKFEFYTLLSESEVIVPAEALPEKTPPPPSKTEVEEAKKADAARAQAILEGKTPPEPVVKKEAKTQFYLQAGSFTERSKAESVRAQLLLSGQDVYIESGQVADKTWHRVLVGPFVSREQLAVAQKQLANNGFSNLLLQQRKGR
ncbi:MAG: SPOR domain-containing protein [Gammaproteobacteria bacterium]|nr:SPOR domain-containing protein [Gammaproteobacteria bacterium]